MPKSIPIPPQTPVVDGVLVKRRHLERGAVHARVDRDIRQWANRHVRESQARTLTLQQRAVRNGYAHGVAAVLEATVAQIMQTERMCRQWRSEMTKQMQALLAHAARHPQALLAAIDDAFEAFAAHASDVPLVVALPASLRTQRESIRARLEVICPAPLTFEWRADDAIAVRRGDHVIEYDPAEYIARATQAIEHHPGATPCELHTMLAAALLPLQTQVDALARDACTDTPAAAPVSDTDRFSHGAHL